MQLHEFGTQKKIPFALTLNGVRVSVTLVAGDVLLSKDGAATTEVAVVNISEIGTTGVYEWTPESAETSVGHYFALIIKDQDATAEFDENLVIHYTGGDASARFSG